MAADTLNHLQWLEISRSALLHNLHTYQNRIGSKTKIMSVVKANAYGHGLKQVVPIIAPLSDFLMVNTLSEALQIRRLKIKNPILIAAPISPSDFALAYQNNFSLCAHSPEYIKSLSALHLPLRLHLKINTGTNRLGLSPIELLSALSLATKSKFHIEGIYTHFHSSDSGSPATASQLDIFNQAVFQTRYLFPHVLAHCASSSASMLLPNTRLDMYRLGVSLYGLWPDPYVKQRAPAGFSIKPVLSWKCRPVQFRKIPAGQTVGYSATYTYKNSGSMAVLPIGYSDGYDRKLSNTGRVWSAENYFPVIGRVAMNFTTIDTSQGKNKLPIVELIGSHITIDEIASKIGTINYEVVSRLSPFIPRIIVK